MVELLEELLSFPPKDFASLSAQEYDAAIQAYKTRLSSMPSQILLGFGSNGEDILDSLDPRANTLAWLSVLNARFEAVPPKGKRNDLTASVSGQRLAHKSILLVSSFDPIQVRYAGHKWRKLVVYIANHARQMKEPELAVSALRTALFRMDPSTGTFTSQHVIFLQLCLSFRLLDLAIPILQNPIHTYPFDKPTDKFDFKVDDPLPCSPNLDSNEYITVKSGLTTEISSSMISEYYTLGAIIYIGLKKWTQALQFLEMVLLSPNHNTANGFMLEAYKKWLIVGCLQNGRIPEAPKGTSGPTMRTLRNASRPYEIIADAFQSGNHSKLLAEIDEAASILQEDGNLGLVQQLIGRSVWFAVLNYQKIYSVIPLATMGDWLGLKADEVYSLLYDLIQSAQLNATIDLPSSGPNNPLIRFHTNTSTGPLAKSEEQLFAELAQQTQRTNRLAAHVKTADERLSLSKGYIELLRRKSRFKDSDNGMEAILPAHDGDWQQTPDPMEDEDLMEVS